jgi:hypothetical protein
VTFTVNTPPPPSLSAVAPASGIVGTSVAVTLTGANFLAGSTVSAGTSGITVSGVSVVSATQITATFAIAAAAVPGSYGVTVTNSAGTSGAVPFTVNPQPPPSLSAVAPAGGIVGTSVAVTLTGANFLAGSTVSAGTSGITVSGVSVLSATQITATFTIAAATAPGSYGVTVTDSAGTSGAVPFTVNAPPAPTLASITPSGGAVGATIPVTLTGTNFLSGATVAANSADITVSNVNVVSSTQITATLAIALTATPGSDSISVATSAGISNSASFTVSAFSPIRVNAGGPAYTDPLGQLWSADNGFTSSGGTAVFTGVVRGASAPALYPSCRRGAGSSPLIYQTAVPNGTYTVNLKFMDAVYTGAGARQLDIVINGQTMVSKFDIVARSGDPWQAYDLPLTVNVTTGQLTIQLVPVVSNAKVSAIEILPGTLPAPALTSIAPANVSVGTTVPITITGTNFLSDVVVNAGPGTTLTNITVASPTTITATLAVASNAAMGTQNVTVTTAGGMTNTAPLAVGP